MSLYTVILFDIAYLVVLDLRIHTSLFACHLVQYHALTWGSMLIHFLGRWRISFGSLSPSWDVSPFLEGKPTKGIVFASGQ